ncbi:putative sensor domain DACNV-containing protein [Pontibacter harenae]|uniref:putative sensor domain DACNV-containing protein n=1 Tax=Pontibacter harenae TaxID=2894083 RepID=UPI001E4312F4|nr:hypothetical protein [Pontibacter harenae]MCC9167307.1 hypothetical protein [Pontibacter harenae]
MQIIRESTYRAAQEVAEAVEKHFTRRIDAAQSVGKEVLAYAPSKRTIEVVLDAAFWASLRREEGNPPKISIAFLPPDQAEMPMLFEQPIPFSPDTLIKIAPGVERPGIHLGIWPKDGELYIWGATRTIPSLCFVVDVSEPGLLVVKHRRTDGYGKFANVAVLKGDQVKVVDENGAALPDCPNLLSSLLSSSTSPGFFASTNVLIQLAVSMRAHHQGGSLLVVPSNSSAWQESIIRPIMYAVQPAYCALADLMLQEQENTNDALWQSKLRKEIDSLAGLTAVDGATIIDDQYNLLAFGAKIGRPPQATPIDQVMLTEPIIGDSGKVVHPSENGGTRHYSAAQFVHDQQDALAMVASQDGRFTIFSWSPCENMVQAHRIDSLLL